MEDGRRRSLFFEDARDLVIGFPGMDDKREPAFLCRLDMDAKQAFLGRARRVIVMKIETGLADGDDFRMIGKNGKPLRVEIGMILRFMRMGAL